MVTLNRRAREAEIDNKLINGIETNPGPRTALQKAARTRRRLKKRIEKKKFKQEGALKNHQMTCSGSRMGGKKKECHVCKKWLIGSN